MLADSNRKFGAGTEQYLASVAESIPEVVLTDRAALSLDRKPNLFDNRDLSSSDTLVVNEAPYMEPTSPWRASENDAILTERRELVLEDLEAVAVEPRDLLLNAVELGILSTAVDDGLVLFDCIDPLPSA